MDHIRAAESDPSAASRDVFETAVECVLEILATSIRLAKYADFLVLP